MKCIAGRPTKADIPASSITVYTACNTQYTYASMCMYLMEYQ